jgi:hypothetical protein
MNGFRFCLRNAEQRQAEEKRRERAAQDAAFRTSFIEEMEADLVWDEQRLEQELSRGRRVRAIRMF